MTGMTQAPRTRPREPFAIGVLLVAIGFGAVLMNLFPGLAAWVVLAIGLTLLAVFAFTRDLAALIPGGILTGLGAGIALTASSLVPEGPASGGVIVLGLALGFISIWAILTVTAGAAPWWPWIPGAVLGTVGVALLLGGRAEELLALWPIILIIIGAVVILRAVARRSP